MTQRGVTPAGKGPRPRREPHSEPTPGAPRTTWREAAELRSATRSFLPQGPAFVLHVRRARSIFRRRLHLTPGATLKELVDAVAGLNQRPITIREMDLDPALSGMCLRGRKEDRIIVSQDTTDWQRLRIKVHELGHLLPWIDPATDDCVVGGHAQGHGIELDPGTLSTQLTSLPPGLVQDVLHSSGSVKLRAAYDTGPELAAEAWATVVPRLLAPGGGTAGPTDAIQSAFANRSW